MDIDKFIEYLVVTNQVDENFSLKEKCPICSSTMDEVDDEAFPYYCPVCCKFISEDKTSTKNNIK